MNPFDEFCVEFLRQSKIIKSFDSEGAFRALAVMQQRRVNKSNISALISKYVKSYETDTGVDCDLQIFVKEILLKDDAYILTVTAFANNEDQTQYGMTLVLEDTNDSWLSTNMPIIVDLRTYNTEL